MTRPPARPRRALAAVAAVVVAMAIAAGCGGGGDGGGATEHRTGGAARPRPATGRAPAATAPAPRLDTAAMRARARDGDLAARVLRRTALLARPGARRVAYIRPHTGWGSQRIMAVAALRGTWIGVRAPELGNDRIGWVAARDVQLLRERWRIDVDLSARTLTARLPGRTRIVIPVAVGAPASPTPAGRFGVTDRLVLDPGTPYGCCVLALTGHQPNVPQGWGGGDRIAIHGTTSEDSIGAAASGGCLRARAADMRRLMRLIPLGTTVTIAA